MEDDMNIFKCFGKGIKEATLRPKMVFFLWLFNVLFAALTYFLFAAAFGGALGTSAIVRDLVRKTDMNAVIEFLTSGGVVLGELATAVIILSILYVFMSIFLYGGILHSLVHKNDQERFAPVFFAGGGKFYGRFFRLTLYSLVLWIPAGVIFVIFDNLLKVIHRDPSHEQLTVIFTIGKVLFALFLIFLIKMIMDYARFKIAGQDSRKVFQALLGSVKFVFGKLGRTLALYYLLGLVGWAVFLIYKVLNATFVQSSMGTILLGFFLAQVFIASRGWLKIAYQAAQGKAIGLI
jgi:hypothetical protein